MTKGRKCQIRHLDFTEKHFEVECSTTWNHLPSSMHRISGTRDKQKIIIFLDIGSSSNELCLHEKRCRYYLCHLLTLVKTCAPSMSLRLQSKIFTVVEVCDLAHVTSLSPFLGPSQDSSST